MFSGCPRTRCPQVVYVEMNAIIFTRTVSQYIYLPFFATVALFGRLLHPDGVPE